MSTERVLAATSASSDLAWLRDWNRQLSVLFVFFGIHASFFTLSSYLLIKEGIRKSRSRLFLFLCTTAMFFISLSHAAVVASVPMSAFRLLSVDATMEDAAQVAQLYRRLKIVINVLLRANFVISDTVVVWRTFVVFQESRKAQIWLVACLCGTYFAVAANTVIVVLEIAQQTTGRSVMTSLLLTLPLLLTNLTATGMMAWKAWNHREYVCDSFLRRKHRSRAELALLLLVESGLGYCAIWVLAMVCNLGYLPGKVCSTLLGALCSICGAYPTFIIIMVGLQRSSVDNMFPRDSGLIRLSPARWSGASNSASVGLKGKNVPAAKRAAYSEWDEFAGSALMTPMSPTRQSWPFAAPPLATAAHRVKRASSPPGAGAFVRLPSSSSFASMAPPSPTSSTFGGPSEPLLPSSDLPPPLSPPAGGSGSVHASVPVSGSASVDVPVPAPTSARPDFPESSARPRETYRLSYPTMAWTGSQGTPSKGDQRASWKETRKGFVRLSTVEEV
ncbi:hypothetical protein HDZ31DRAFT_64955 [Schizophyllum fasciatum]